MSAALEVIIVDKGGGDGQPMHSPGAAGAPRTPGPDDRVTGPKKSEAQAAGKNLETAVQRVADVLGIGGLTGKAISLRNAFSALYDAVTAASYTRDAGRRVADLGPVRTGDIKSPPRAPAGPPPQTPTRAPFGPTGLPTPVSQSVRNRAAGDVVAPPVIVGPNAAQGAAVGPEAGAGASTVLMGRLAAAAAPAALAIAGFAIGIGVAGIAVKKFTDIANSEATRLSGLSGHLAGSSARAELRSEFADIRRAQRVGPGLAQVQDSTSQVMEKVADINTELLKAVVDLANQFKPAIPLLVNTLNLLAAGIPVTVDGITDILNFLNRHTRTRDELNQQVINIGKFVGALVDIANADRDSRLEGDDPFVGLFFGGVPSAPRRAPARKPPGRAPLGGGDF